MAFTQDVTPPGVRSEPMVNGQPAASKPAAPARAAPGGAGGNLAIGLVLIVFGAIGWITGARYTLYGWVLGLNMFLAWLGLPLALPWPSGWWLLSMIPIGLVYSRVEIQVWWAHRRRGQALALFAVGWLLIVATDVGTTYIGVRSPQPGAWPITLAIAASPSLAFAWAAVLTFASDWLILGGAKLIRR